jgi:FkbM family methyltransferase
MRLWDRLHAYHRFWRFRLHVERQEIALLLAGNYRGATVLDVGANRGAYSYWMHRAVAPAGRVVAFEPQPELASYLGELKNAFKLRQLSIVGSAVSDKSGERSLVRPRKHWGASSFHLDPNQPDCDVLRVPVTTLDEHFAQHDGPPVRFIKCDVQDHEPFVFRGAKNLLTKHRPTLLFEQIDKCVRTGEAASFLAELGYSGYFFYQRQLVSVCELPRLRPLIPAPHLNYVYRFEGKQPHQAAA